MKEKKNTAIVCLSPNSGGMEIDTLKLAKKLNPYMNIILISKKNTFISKEAKIMNNIISKEVHFKSSLSISLIIQIRKIIKEQNIKNFIFFGASELKSIYFSILGLSINLIVRHGTTKTRPKKDWFHKLIYSDVNYHVSICKHLKNNVEYIIPFGKQSKSVLIYSSVKSFDFIKQHNKKLVLLHTGRICEGKGQIDAIKACDILVKKDIDFIFFIVGGYEKKFKNKFLKFYESIPYKNKIKLVGFSNEIEEYLKKSDVYLFPSYGEGLSNSFLEAISAKLKCISYKNTSFTELKELGLSFELVEDKNIDKLQEALIKIATKEITYDIKNNQKIINQIFSETTEVKNYLEILK